MRLVGDPFSPDPATHDQVPEDADNVSNTMISQVAQQPPHVRLVLASRSTRETAEAPDLAQVFRTCSGYVAGIGHRLLGRNHEVDDLVQDVFIEAQRSLGQLRDPAAIRGWLATITVRLARRRLGRRRLQAFLGLDDSYDYSDVAAPTSRPDDREVLRRLYRLLDEVPVADRLAWLLRRIEGHQLDEVAALCGCSMATAKRRITRTQALVDEVLGDG